MTRIAITGATGFVGRACLRELLARGWQARVLLRAGRSLEASDQVEIVAGSMEDSAALLALVREVDAVIHIAGAISGRHYNDFARTNAAGCLHLVQAMAAANPSARLVHVSSLAAREPALSDYAASKRAGEEIITSSRLSSLIIRPPAVYGPHDPALRPLWQMLARGLLPRLGPSSARFSLLHVDDLARALADASQSSARPDRPICLHDGKPGGYSWAELASLAAARRGGRVRIVPVPRALLGSLAMINLFGARLHRGSAPVLVPGKVRELVHPDWVCDNTVLPGCPDWTPMIEFSEALNQLPGWSRYQ